jgi:serine protease AprX
LVADTYLATDLSNRIYADRVVVFAAGNLQAVDASLPKERRSLHAGEIGSYPCAKNVITVGACGSSRNMIQRGPDGNPAYDRYDPPQRSLIPFRSPRPRGPPGNPDEVAWYSCQGPIRPGPGIGDAGDQAFGRIKPDVVAPGTCIYSARSQVQPLLFMVDPDRTHPKYDFFGKSSDTKWIYDSGTSMAAPMVAGCCAVLRSAIKKTTGNRTPSSALIKALLINNAVDLSLQRRAAPTPAWRPQIGPAPDNVQGFGRVDIVRSLLNVTDTVNGGMRDAITFARRPVIPTRRVRIPDTRLSVNLSVSLVWIDQPGELLQTQLSLKVAVSDTNFRYADPQPVDGSPSRPDTRNNAQRVVWRNIPAGVAVVSVEAGAVSASTNLRYALVWYVWE